MSSDSPKKSLGQHWLSDVASLTSICDSASIKQGDVVLEIGPGTGELTAQLITRGAEVIALEIDNELIVKLRQRFAQYPSSIVVIEQGDIRTYDFGTLSVDYKIVANIPYYLTSHLLRLLSETPNSPSTAVLLIQKEVARRVVARPGEMSLLSVSVQYYFEPSLGPVVPAKLFTPPPKVDSQVLILHRHAQPLFKGVNEKEFFRIVKAGYSARRKKLRSSLSGGLHISKPEAEVLLKRAGIDPSRRAQELSITDWHNLYLSAGK